MLHLIAGGFAATLRSNVQKQHEGTTEAASSAASATADDADNKSRLWPIFKTPAALIFLATVMACSSYFAAIQSYLFLWLDDLEAAPDIMGKQS